MRHAMFAALVLFAAAPTVAAAEPAHSFRQDGASFDYTASRDANGVVLLRGEVQATGDRFTLRIDGRRVSGMMAGSPVDFTVSDATVARLTAEVPASTPMQTASLAAD